MARRGDHEPVSLPGSERVPDLGAPIVCTRCGATSHDLWSECPAADEPPPPVVPALTRSRVATTGPLAPSDRARQAARDAFGGRDLPDWVVAPAAVAIELHLRQAAAQGAAAERAVVAPLVAALLAALPRCGHSTNFETEQEIRCIDPATHVSGADFVAYWCAKHAGDGRDSCPVAWLEAAQALEQWSVPLVTVAAASAPCAEAEAEQAFWLPEAR